MSATWARLPVGGGGTSQYYYTGTFTTGTEANLLGPNDGMPLAGLNGFGAIVEAVGTMTAGSAFNAYVFNQITGKWWQVNDASLDLAGVVAAAGQAWSGFAIISPFSRIAWLPNGVTVASVLYLYPTFRLRGTP